MSTELVNEIKLQSQNVLNRLNDIQLLKGVQKKPSHFTVLLATTGRIEISSQKFHQSSTYILLIHGQIFVAIALIV